MTHRSARGLAAAAVGALTLTGLAAAATPAQAAAPAVRLLSQFTGNASTDAINGSQQQIRLTALPADSTATVTFQVNLDSEATATDPGWRELGLAPSPVGDYRSATWDGTLGDQDLFGERVALRVTSVTAGGTSYDVRAGVEIADNASDSASAVPSVSITNQAARAFVQPYTSAGRTRTLVRVTGRSSAPTGAVELSWWNPSAGAFTGRTQAQLTEAFPGKTGPFAEFNYGSFDQALDITGYDAGEDSLAVAAARGSDTVVPLPLVAQTIENVSTSVEGQVRAGESAPVVVTVTDGSNQPVVGAEVRRLSDGALVGYTDVVGQVATTQAAGTESYYANATDADEYADGQGDKVSAPTTVAAYTPEPSGLEIEVRDGLAFDVDEYAPGDISVLVTDQEGRPVGAGVQIGYRLTPTNTSPPENTVGTTDANGRVTVPFDRSAGVFDLYAQLPANGQATAADSETFTAGQAVLSLTPRAATVDAAAGGQVGYIARLTVDGEPLPGRDLALTYRRGVEVVPGGAADAGILDAAGRRVLARTVTTNANGSVRFTVDDAAETPQAGESGALTAATATTKATEDSTVTGNAGARDTSAIRFGSVSPGRATIALSGRSKGAKPDVLAVAGPTSLAGERVQVFRVAAKGKRVLVTTRALDASGDLRRLAVRDRNKAKRTTYVAVLVGSARVQSATSRTVTVR